MAENFLVYVNGELLPKKEAKVSVYDRGFMYGDGVYEGIRAYNGLVFMLEEHINRLYDSAKMIRLVIPLSKDEMMDAVLNTLRANHLRECYIRLIVTRGESPLGIVAGEQRPTIVIMTEPLDPLGPEKRKKGLTAIISAIRRTPTFAVSPEIKSLNYLNSFMARFEAVDSGVDEAIMLDVHGFVSEGAIDNIFIVKNKKIATPTVASSILRGITRQLIINLARGAGYEVDERNVTVYDLLTADEVFLTGTAFEVVHVTKISGTTIGDGKPGPIYTKILNLFREATRNLENGVPI